MEHRLGRRIAVFEPVLLRGATGKVTEAVLTEISLSGAWVRTTERWPVLCTLHVLLSREADSQGAAPAVLAAQVIRHAPSGIAIEWLELATSLVQARLNARVG
jgi:hypothetical protein